MIRRSITVCLVLLLAVVVYGQITITGKTYTFGTESITTDPGGDVIITPKGNGKIKNQGPVEILVASGSNPELFLKDGDVATGNDGFDTDVVAYMSSNSSTGGGLETRGLTDADITAYHIIGWQGVTNPTDTTAAVVIEAMKDDGAGGDDPVGNAELALDVKNDGTSRMTLTGAGDLAMDGDLTPGGQLKLSAGATYTYDPNLGDLGATETIDWTAGNKWLGIIDEAVTLSFTDPTAQGMASLELWLVQDGTGGFAITWPANVRWDSDTLPTATTAAGDGDRWVFSYNSTLDQYWGQAATGYSP